MADDVLSIGEMCARFGVTPRTLRFYEAKELIRPLRHGQKRLYTRRCRARLKLILQGKRFGFRLEDIRQLLNSMILAITRRPRSPPPVPLPASASRKWKASAMNSTTRSPSSASNSSSPRP